MDPSRTREDAAERRKCCQQSFLASVVGLKREERGRAAGWRVLLGLVVLAGVHLQMLLLCALRGITEPRYRPIARFQVRYFRDVMRQEIRRARVLSQ